MTSWGGSADRLPDHSGGLRLGSGGTPGQTQPAGGEDLVEGLTGPQRASVVHRGGPLLIVAGAGSGKTRVLTRRIAHLIASGDAAPWQILAITFTNKAADEMRRRVADLVGPRAARMWVSTFHSACVRILRAHGDRLGYKGSFTIYDDADSRRLVEIIARELDIDTKKMSPRSMLGQISQAKSRQQGPVQFRQAAISIFDRFATTAVELTTIPGLLGAAFLTVGKAVLPVLLACVGAALLAGGFQSGFQLTPKAFEVLKALKADGWFEVRSKGSHVQLKHAVKAGLVTLPMHGAKDIKPGEKGGTVVKLTVPLQPEG